RSAPGPAPRPAQAGTAEPGQWRCRAAVRPPSEFARAPPDGNTAAVALKLLRRGRSVAGARPAPRALHRAPPVSVERLAPVGGHGGLEAPVELPEVPERLGAAPEPDPEP